MCKKKSHSNGQNFKFFFVPRNIVSQINSGETDISFTVQSASIIFADVVKFREYASNLSPLPEQNFLNWIKSFLYFLNYKKYLYILIFNL